MGILKNMKIWKRLSICFGALGLTLLVVSMLTWWGIAYLLKGHRAVVAEAHKANITHNMIDTLSQINLTTWSLIAQRSPAAKAGLNGKTQELRDTYKKYLTELKTLAETPKDKELLANFEEALASGKATNSQVMAMANNGQEPQASDMYLIEGSKIKARSDNALKDYLKYREEVAATIGQQVERAQQQVKFLLAIALLAGIALAAVIGTAIARIYVTDISSVVAHTKLLASGDFSVDVPGSFTCRKDEFGDLARSYQSMVENIRQLLMDVSGEVQVLASSSTELSASSEE
ncbi:MAG TPA: MCP four helix bundle domain-containing protein, partial [Holophaga sp.]|nr:MCP four helix bundle domain-containing protein [Holophaga sp.]